MYGGNLHVIYVHWLFGIFRLLIIFWLQNKLRPKLYAGLMQLSLLIQRFFRTVADLFSLWTIIPAHFCIVFLFEGLGKPFYIHSVKRIYFFRSIMMYYTYNYFNNYIEQRTRFHIKRSLWNMKKSLFAPNLIALYF